MKKLVILCTVILLALLPALGCAKAEFEVSAFNISPAEVVSGEAATVSANVDNIGGAEGVYIATLTIDAVGIETKEIALTPGARETITFRVVEEAPGTYQVGIGELAGSLRVLTPAEFVLSDFSISPSEAEVWEEVTVTIKVENVGEAEGTFTGTLNIDGAEVETKDITVAGGTTETLTFTVTNNCGAAVDITVGESDMLGVTIDVKSCPTNANDFFTYNSGNDTITTKHDLWSETNPNRTKLFDPSEETDGYWNGAPSLLKHDGTYYVSHRVRDGPKNRGKFMVIHSSTDLANWSQEWSVSYDDISNISISSFEKASLRYYNGYFYLYFCVDPLGRESWVTYAVKSTTMAGLETQLEDYNNYITMTGLAEGERMSKDPEVCYLNGTYYMLIGVGGATGYNVHIYKSSNPEGPWSFVVDLNDVFEQDFSGSTGGNPGTLWYNPDNGYYIYHTRLYDEYGKKRWWWAVSTDLDTWDGVGNDEPATGDGRYLSYITVDPNRVIIVAEWDDIPRDGKSIARTFLWDYSDDTPE